MKEGIPKYLQIVHSIQHAILKGTLHKGEQVFSINELSNEFLFCRDTVQKAYNILRDKGVLISIPGKGYFINRVDIDVPLRILLLFNKISDYKKQIYNVFVRTLASHASFDLRIHHSDIRVFQRQLSDLGKDYDHYVVMPHFEEQAKVAEILRMIPSEKLMLLDKDMPDFNLNCSAVYQDFRNDIYEALEQGMDLLKKYNDIILVQPRIPPYPREISAGIRNFAINHTFTFQDIPAILKGATPCRGEAYIVTEETDLVNLIKICRQKDLVIGRDVGIISYNDMPYKEILLDGITVITTDHARMGENAARLILENRREKVKNPSTLIRRRSL